MKAEILIVGFVPMKKFALGNNLLVSKLIRLMEFSVKFTV